MSHFLLAVSLPVYMLFSSRLCCIVAWHHGKFSLPMKYAGLLAPSWEMEAFAEIPGRRILVIRFFSFPEDLRLISKLYTGDIGQILMQRWSCHPMGLEQDPAGALLCLLPSLSGEMENATGAHRLWVLLSNWHPVPWMGTCAVLQSSGRAQTFLGRRFGGSGWLSFWAST